MAAIFWDGFDWLNASTNFQGLSMRWDNLGSSYAQIANGQGTHGSNAFWVSSGGLWARKNLPSQTTYLIGLNLKVHPGDNGTNAPPYTGLLLLQENTFTQVGLVLQSDGHLRAYVQGGAQYVSNLQVPYDLAYHFIQFKVTVSNTGAGSITLRIDGSTAISQAGINTKGASTSDNYITQVLLGAHYDLDLPGAINVLEYYVDDFHVFDTTGSHNNDFTSDFQIYTLMPDAPGTNTTWTPTPGPPNWGNVNVIPPNDAAYNTTSTAGNKDSYNLQDLPFTNGTVLAVGVTARTEKTDGGPRVTHNLVVSSGATGESGDQAVPSSFASLMAAFETDPATAAPWTVPAVNAAEAGVKLVS